MINTVAFGGVGTSGTGSYRGKASFDTFTHLRTVAETPGWMDALLRVRYMPYNWSDLRRVDFLTGQTPDFDRARNVVGRLTYWSRLLFGLGSSSTKGALARWALVLATLYASVVGLTVRKS